MQPAEAAGQARFDGAQRHVENFGDFVVGTILQIKQGDGRLIDFIQLRQGLEHLRGVEAVDGGRRHDRQFRRGVFQFDVRESASASAASREIRGAGW